QLTSHSLRSSLHARGGGVSRSARARAIHDDEVIGVRNGASQSSAEVVRVPDDGAVVRLAADLSGARRCARHILGDSLRRRRRRERESEIAVRLDGDALLALTADALDAVGAFNAAAVDTVRQRVWSDDRLDDALMDRHQRSVHGLAWIATQIAALE